MEILQKYPIAFRIYKLFVNPLLSADPAPAMALLSLTSLWWAIVLVFTDALAGFRFNTLLLSHGDQSFWVLVFGLVGVGLIISRFVDVKAMERLFTFISAGVWMFIAVLLISVQPISFPGGTYFLLSILAMWAFVRLGYGE